MPADAVYFGGDEAGYFIDFKFDRFQNHSGCIYDAEDGSLIIDCAFTVDEDGAIEPPKSFVSWDGVTLVLAGGAMLHAVTETQAVSPTLRRTQRAGYRRLRSEKATPARKQTLGLDDDLDDTDSTEPEPEREEER